MIVETNEWPFLGLVNLGFGAPVTYFVVFTSCRKSLRPQEASKASLAQQCEAAALVTIGEIYSMNGKKDEARKALRDVLYEPP